MAYPMYNSYYQPQQAFIPPVQQPVSQQATNQMQNGGFMLVPSEDIVRTYPVAPGNCVTFKIEGQPIVMEKSMGFSQLEAPRMKRFRLVEEDTPVSTQAAQNEPINLEPMNDAINDLKNEISTIWGEINGIKEQAKKPGTKRTKDGDD